MRVGQPPGRAAATALVAWGNAWLTGHVGLDEAVDAVEEAAGPQTVCGIAGQPAELPLRRGLGDLRVAGMQAMRLSLPAPGDLLGLTGPPALNAAALESGQAVLIGLADGSVIGLVPAEDLRGSSYVGVRWSVHEARPGVPDVPSLQEADHRLSLAMREATEALLRVDDVAGVPPEIADALATLRDGAESALAPGYPPRAHRVDALAARLAVVVDLARSVAGQGLTADQMRRRDDALRLLDRAARRARVAAHNSAFDPVP